MFDYRSPVVGANWRIPDRRHRFIDLSSRIARLFLVAFSARKTPSPALLTEATLVNVANAC